MLKNHIDMINIYPGIPEDAIKVVEVGKGWMMCVVLSMRGILQELPFIRNFVTTHLMRYLDPGHLWHLSLPHPLTTRLLYGNRTLPKTLLLNIDSY